MTPVPTRRVAPDLPASRLPRRGRQRHWDPRHGLTTRHRTQGLSLWSLNIVGGEISDLPRHSLTLRSLQSTQGFFLWSFSGTTWYDRLWVPRRPSGGACAVPAVPHCIRPSPFAHSSARCASLHSSLRPILIAIAMAHPCRASFGSLPLASLSATSLAQSSQHLGA